MRGCNILKISLWVVFFLLWSAHVFAQEADTVWVRRYNGPGNGDDYASAIAIDDSGNVCVTGGSGTIKYNAKGGMSWISPVGGGDLTLDDSGYVYVTGESEGDYITIKYYPNGDIAWLRTYDGPGDGWDSASAITVDGSGNVYVTGRSYGSGPWWEGNDYATIKYFPNGDTAWIRRYDGSLNLCDEASDIAVDGSGNIYVTGGINGNLKFASCPDYGIIKYNPNGDTIWVRTYDSLHCVDWASAIVIDDSGYAYVTGTSEQDFVTIKYHPDGYIVWLRRYNLYSDYAKAIAVDDARNVYVTGSSGYWSDGIWVSYYTTIRYYPNGDIAWVRGYNKPGKSSSEAYAIKVDDLGNVYVTGESDRDTNYLYNLDYATIKYDSSGDQLWISRYNGPGNGYDEAFAIAIDDSGYVYVTGYSDRDTGDYLTNYDYATIKYSTLIFLCGDCNGDGKISVSDVICLINCLFKGGFCPIPFRTGDANGDGKVSVSDVVYLINYLFKGGPPPVCL